MNLAQTMEMNALAAKARKLQGRLNFRGLLISIENKAGSTRTGVDADGGRWSTKMKCPYGYIRSTEGVDGDHVDCFIGPNVNAENVYVIHTQNPETGEYDEDKCMLGFGSAKAAKDCFLQHYDDPKFFQSMTTLPFDEFKQTVFETKGNPKKIAAAILAYGSGGMQ